MYPALLTYVRAVIRVNVSEALTSWWQPQYARCEDPTLHGKPIGIRNASGSLLLSLREAAGAEWFISNSFRCLTSRATHDSPFVAAQVCRQTYISADMLSTEHRTCHLILTGQAVNLGNLVWCGVSGDAQAI